MLLHAVMTAALSCTLGSGPQSQASPISDHEQEQEQQDASDAAGLQDLQAAAADWLNDNNQAEPSLGAPASPQGASAPQSPANLLGRNLNRMNPEISATADMAALLSAQQPFAVDDVPAGFRFRELEVDLRSWVDPFTEFRAQFGLSPEGAEVEEVKLRWSGLWPGLSLTTGRFLLGLGTINRWHAHAWDQYDLPLALRAMLGDEGLLQTGLRAQYLLPFLPALPTSLDVELVSGADPLQLSLADLRPPALLLRASSQVALGGLGYGELGLSGLLGLANDAVDPLAVAGLPATGRTTDDFVSADLNLAYDPPGGKDRLRVFVRSQVLYREQGTWGEARARQLGAFVYVNTHLSSRLEIGLRGDLLSDPGLQLDLRAEHLRLGLSPYVTLWQSEFARLRAQYRVEAGAQGFVQPEQSLFIQLTAAVGPHRHERY